MKGAAVDDDAGVAPGRSLLSRLLLLLAHLPRLLGLMLIRAYQLVLSPLLPVGVCRFYPSCSQYAFIAVQRHGLIWGCWLAARRLLRCHPWNPGGVDDVPELGWRGHVPRPGSGRLPVTAHPAEHTPTSSAAA